jgi:hypothetical protein
MRQQHEQCEWQCQQDDADLIVPGRWQQQKEMKLTMAATVDNQQKRHLFAVP